MNSWHGLETELGDAAGNEERKRRGDRHKDKVGRQYQRVGNDGIYQHRAKWNQCCKVICGALATLQESELLVNVPRQSFTRTCDQEK